MVQSHVEANVRAEIARRNKSQADVAELLGLTRQAVSRRLLGRVAFRIDELQKIAAFLGVPLTALIAEPAEQAS